MGSLPQTLVAIFYFAGTIWLARYVKSSKSFRFDLDLCVGCLCHVASSCDPSYDCTDLLGPEEQCGMYRLTEVKWRDAGKLLPSGMKENQALQEWQWCALDSVCSTKAVRAYLKRYLMVNESNGPMNIDYDLILWLQDCDEDGITDCLDVTLVYNVGQPTCGRKNLTTNTPEIIKFKECVKKMSTLMWNIKK